MSKKYVKKPIPVEAVQWTGKNYEEQCKHMEMIAKRYFDSLQSEEYVGVTVDGNKMYVVIS